MSAVQRAPSRKAREVAHPQLFRSMLKKKPALYFPTKVTHPPMNVEALVVGSAASVAFDHARRSASQPRALQDAAVRSESPLSPDRSGRAGAVPSAYLRRTGSTDKSQVHRGKIKRGSAHTPDATAGFRRR